jgi:hypothetical protein
MNSAVAELDGANGRTRWTARGWALLLLLVLVGLSAGCRRGGAAPLPAVAAAPAPDPSWWNTIPNSARLYYDNAGGIQDSLRLVIRDDETLRDVWGRATSRQSAPPPLPTIDFSRDMLILVSSGRKTPEDQIRVDSVGVQRESGPNRPSPEPLTAIVRTLEGCRRINVDAFPVEIVRVARYEGPVQFLERRERLTNCVPSE